MRRLQIHIKSELSKVPSSNSKFFYYCGTLFKDEYTKNKSKGTVGDSFQFDDFPPQNGGNPTEDEETEACLQYIYGNSDCM